MLGRHSARRSCSRVHTVVSFDFAVSIVPLWHATIFPPFFVAGAIYSGFAMVIVLAIPMRQVVRLEDFFTDHHLDICGKVMLGDRLPRDATATSAKSGWPGTATALYEWGTTMRAHVRPVRLVVLVPDLLRTASFPLTLLWSKKIRTQRRSGWI